MFILDLRVALLLVFGALALTAVLAIYLDRHFFRKPRSQTLALPNPSPEPSGSPLLNDLAHELRTPLAVLLTHLEIQRSDTVPLETKQESLGLMQAEARRMSRMVSNLLELAELETRGLMDKRLVDLRALAAQVIAELQLLAQARGIDLMLCAAEGAFWVNGDSFYLKQALLNLIENAIKYSRAGDRVEISLECDSARAKILCAVCDTGPGIAAEHLPYLTRRFYRAASDEISGSGLGLALVAAILELHNSALEIESRTSTPTGTCMRFALDLAQEPGAST